MVEEPDDVGMRQAGPLEKTYSAHSVSSPDKHSDSVESDGQGLSAIRVQIENTQAEMAETLNAIQERISYDYIKRLAEEKLLDALEERARDIMNTTGRMSGQLGHSIMETIKEHPIPVTLLGIGLSWLVVNALNSSKENEELVGRYDIEDEEGIPEELYQAGLEEPGGREYMEAARPHGYQRIRSVAEKVRKKAGNAQHRAEHFAEGTAEKARHLGSEVRERVGKARSKAGNLVGDNTLLLGVAAVTLGTVFGLLLPKMGREQNLLEGARETVVDKTRELGHKAMEKAERVASKAGRAAREEAERQHLIGQGFSQES
jgi:uncharacterized protein YjbJ (UPF0337 family)